VALADFAFQRCIDPACGYTCGVEEVRTECPKCGDLLDVAYDWQKAQPPKSLKYFEQMWSRRNEPLRFSGIYRFHELLPFATPDSVGVWQTFVVFGVIYFVAMMAGAFGYEAEHFDVSMRMAEASLLPAVRKAKLDTMIVADGTSCRHQIHDGAGRAAVHVAQVLRSALQSRAASG